MHREQSKLKSQLITVDSPDVRSWRKGNDLFFGLHSIAGVDISFVKGTQRACAMMVILTFPDLRVRERALLMCIDYLYILQLHAG